MISIILGKRLTQTIVDGRKHNGMRENLRRARAAGRQRQEDTRGEEDKKKHGDDNVQIHFVRSHEFIRSTTMPSGERLTHARPLYLSWRSAITSMS